MVERIVKRECVGLLVSVRSAAEAVAALEGGADVIDVKEPSRGPLGAADAATIADVVRAVEGRVPVTAAAGELVDWQSADADWSSACRGVSLVKFGLSGYGARGDWPARWRRAMATIPAGTGPVAAVYADWKRAAAPPPDEVLDAAVRVGCRAVLVDTWYKRSGTLLSHWPLAEIRQFAELVRTRELALVLAGSLGKTEIKTVAGIGPQLVAVRGAACEGGREGAVCPQRVRALCDVLSRDATFFP